MNLLGKLQNQYEQLWKQAIRPQRNHYVEESLGPKSFALEGQHITREDFQLTSIKGLTFHGSIWIPQFVQDSSCVVYLHGNDGNRIEGMEYLGKIMKLNVALCTFDFCGCGNAEGEFVSMGYYEQQDLSYVIQYLKEKWNYVNFGFWGKGMGAVAALLYMRKSIDIKAAIFDNPYKNAKCLVQQMVKNHPKIPSLMAGGAVKMISKTIEDKAAFDIHNVNPYKFSVPGLHCPAFFVVSSNDELVSVEQIKDLFSAYAGENKHLCLIKGKQSDTRTEQCVNDCLNFLAGFLNEKKRNQSNETKKEFDFFQLRKNIIDQDKEREEIKKQQKHNNVDFFAENELSVNQDKVIQPQKKNKQFSFQGLMSIFTRDNKKEESQVEQKNQDLKDGYQQLRKRLIANRKQNANVSSDISSQKMRRLRQKMSKQLSDEKIVSNENNLRQWTFVSF